MDLVKWEESIPRFLEAWTVARICPRQIVAPKETLSLNVLTLGVSLLIFIAARVSEAGSDLGIGTSVIATIISALIAFFTGYVVRIFYFGADVDEISKKWGLFFVMMWITSLISLLAFDAVPHWLGIGRSTNLIINTMFGPDLNPVMSDMLRGAFFSAFSLILLLIKSKVMDASFRWYSACALVTIAIGLAVNTLLVTGFIYGKII